MSETWFVYLVRCNDGSLYCGISNDVEKRVIKHNTGKGARYTKSHGPVSLVYQEKVGTMGQALRREHQIKKWSKKRKEMLISGSSSA